LAVCAIENAWMTVRPISGIAASGGKRGRKRGSDQLAAAVQREAAIGQALGAQGLFFPEKGFGGPILLRSVHGFANVRQGAERVKAHAQVLHVAGNDGHMPLAGPWPSICSSLSSFETVAQDAHGLRRLMNPRRHLPRHLSARPMLELRLSLASTATTNWTPL